MMKFCAVHVVCKVINKNDNENTHTNDHEGIYSPDINTMFRVKKSNETCVKCLNWKIDLDLDMD